MDTTSKTPHERISDLVCGQLVVLPDLQAAMGHWPVATNPNIAILEEAVTARLEWLFPGPRYEKRLQKMKRGNIALFSAMWWPFAPIKALHTIAWLSIWLMAWDDETDSIEFTDLLRNFDRASQFRRDTLRCIQENLQLHQGSAVSEDPFPTRGSHGSAPSASDSIFIHSFKDVGRAVSCFDEGRLSTHFFDELRFFIEMTELEQKAYLNGDLPTVNDYLDRRMGSSGVYVCLALTEYTLDLTIPEHIFEDPDMKLLRHQINMNISVCNDIFSLKKELQNGQIDSLVPLLTLKLGSLQKALESAFQTVKDSIKIIDAATDSLLERHAHHPTLHLNLLKLINSYKHACTANLKWSLLSGRYQLDSNSTEGRVFVQL